MLPVGREPVLARVVAELRAAGVTEILFVISDQKPQIRSFFGDGCPGDGDVAGVRFDYVVQKQQRGSGDALLCAEEWIGGDRFLVAFGDCLVTSASEGEPVRRLIQTHVRHGATATLLVEAVAPNAVSRYGVVAPAGAIGSRPIEPFLLSDLVEKPRVDQAPSNLVIAARMALEPSVLTALRRSSLDARGELNIPDAVRPLLRAGAVCCAVPLLPGEMRRDIGSVESYLLEFVRCALNDPGCGDQVRELARRELQAGSD